CCASRAEWLSSAASYAAAASATASFKRLDRPESSNSALAIDVWIADRMEEIRSWSDFKSRAAERNRNLKRAIDRSEPDEPPDHTIAFGGREYEALRANVIWVGGYFGPRRSPVSVRSRTAGPPLSDKTVRTKG